MRQHPGEEGVSEVVGVMLLVGVTVLAVAIVAVVLLSGPQPDEIPRATVVAGNKSGSLVLAHEGGDPLREGEYRIYIDAGSGLVDETANFSKPAGGVWSIGRNITYNKGGADRGRVVVTTISGGSETILAEPEFRGGGAGFSPDPVEPGTVSNGSGGSEGGGGLEETPIFIVIPEIGTTMKFTKVNGNYYSPISARVTSDSVRRVDFTMYDVANSTNYAIDHRKDASGGPGNGTYEARFEVKPGNGNGHIGSAESVVVVAIAFNETNSVVGCDARIVKIEHREN